MRRDTGPDQATVQQVLARSTWGCEVCGDGLYAQRGWDWHIHHRRPRAMGGTKWNGCNLPSNLLVVCKACHEDIESRREVALKYGRLVPQGTDPETVPCMVNARSLYLGNDGQYHREAP